MVGEDEAVEIVGRLAEADIAAWATVPTGGAPMVDVANAEGFSALVLGNEPNGLTDDVLAACAGSVTVETTGSVDSLNVAVAGSVALYEACRTREPQTPDRSETVIGDRRAVP